MARNRNRNRNNQQNENIELNDNLEQFETSTRGEDIKVQTVDEASFYDDQVEDETETNTVEETNTEEDFAQTPPIQETISKKTRSIDPRELVNRKQGTEKKKTQQPKAEKELTSAERLLKDRVSGILENLSRQLK